MKFLSVLKGIGKAALGIGSAAVPALTAIQGGESVLMAISGAVIRSIAKAEADNGPGKGEAKKIDALSTFDVALPAIMGMAEGITGKDLLDEDLFIEGIHELMEAKVKIMNSMHFLPKAVPK